MKMKDAKKIVHVALSMELYEKLKAHARETTRTVPGLVRYILREYFEKL